MQRHLFYQDCKNNTNQAAEYVYTFVIVMLLLDFVQ